MRYYKIQKYDSANGAGIHTSLFFTGCKFHCKGCFNHEIWDFNSGKEFTVDAKQELFSYLEDPHTKGLAVLGGEPLQQDLNLLYELLSEYRIKFPNKDLWLWTGYYLTELGDTELSIINLCDYVVDGRFEQDKSILGMPFRGSSNQTIWEKDENGQWVRSPLNDR